MTQNQNPDYLVASVEVGNTTTKCILTKTDLRTGLTNVIEKYVLKTSDVRAPKDDEIVFAQSITGLSFSREALAELVEKVILKCFENAEISADDVHYVARSSGIVSQSSKSNDANEIIIALAEGCFLAGIPPSKMSGVLSADLLPKNISKFSKLSTVYFDGAVAGSILPEWQGGSAVPNEMEGELACAGIKETAKHKNVDFRNPCIVIDMGTTLSGRILSKGDPYAKTIGNFCGYSGAIADFMVKDLVSEVNTGNFYENDIICASDIFSNKIDELSFFQRLKIRNKLKKAVNSVNDLLFIGKLEEDVKFVGPFEVCPKKALDFGVNIYACDFVKVHEKNEVEDRKLKETESSKETKEALAKIGFDFYKDNGVSGLSMLIDEVMTDIAFRLLKSVSADYNLNDYKIGITGRSGISGNKQKLLINKISSELDYVASPENIVFTDDGLAGGAAVMARCIHSLGSSKSPIGGNVGDSCILGKRKKLQKTRN